MNAFKYNVKYQLNSLNSCQWSLNNNNRVASKPLEWGFLLQNLSFCLKNSARVHSYYLQYEPVQYESYIQGVFIFKVNSLRSWVKSPAVFVGFLGLRLFPLLLATQRWLPEKSGSKTPNMQLVACWFSLVASIYWEVTLREANIQNGSRQRNKPVFRLVLLRSPRFGPLRCRMRSSVWSSLHEH